MNRPLTRIFVLLVALAAGGLLVVQLFGPAVSSAQDGNEEIWRSSAAPVDLPTQQLSPPDSPNVHFGRETEALQPQSPDGILLRDFRLPGSALRPRTSSVDYYWGAGGGCIYNSGGNVNEIFNVPLTLPEGATINTVRMYFNDNVAGVNSVGWLSVYDLYGALEQEWVMTSSGQNGPGFGDTGSEPIEHVVDYSVYSYALNWRPTVQGTSMQLCGFRVYYEAPFGLSFLPWVSGD